MSLRILPRSLRWRLPLFFGTLVIIMVSTFLWATSSAVEHALVGAGHGRAQAGADEVAHMLSQAIAGHVREGARLQAHPSIRAVLDDASPAATDAARATLVTSTVPAARRAEIWNASGSLLLEITTEPADSVVGFRAYPAADAPTAAGFSELRAFASSSYYDHVAEIRDSTPDAPLLGYLRRYGRLQSSPGGTVRRLIGEDAVLRIGGSNSPVWTDFFDVVEPPPDPAGRPGEHRAADGTRWVAATALIEATPWSVWVGFPRDLVVAPASNFMQRMATVAFVFLLLGGVAAGALGVRLTQPLHALARAAEDIAAGDYSQRVRSERRDEIGRMSRAFNVMADRVEHAHDALQASHEQTHFALATARIGVWESHLDTGRLTCSESMHLVLGCSHDALPETAAAFLELVHEDDREAVQQVLEGRGTNGDVVDLECRVLAPTGPTRWVAGKGRTRFDQERRPVSVLGVVADVTDSRKLEAQLFQAQKMEAVGQLAGGVAHDFNNLLTAVIGHADLLLPRMTEPDLRESVQQILDASASAASLTQQLLAFSRHQVLHVDVVDVNAVITRMEKLLGRLIGENIARRIELAPVLSRVRVDAARLEQVIVNLAVNARDAMPDGGTLTITSADVELGDDYGATHAAVSPGRYVMLSVTDTGIGMDATIQEHLFEPFFTTKPAGSGSGLGLATVYGIVKQSGGHIYVYSEPGHGSKFKIYLPATQEDPVAVRTDAAPSADATGAETILVVDDSEAVRAVTARILSQIGYHVLVAESGEDALRLLEETNARPDLVISDVIMPGMTGPELARRLAVQYADLRVLLTSGYSGEAIDRHGLDDGRASFIEKPYTRRTLSAKVREVLAG